MAWTYFCDDDQKTISANTKEELAQKVMDHVNQLHGGDMTMDEAMKSVNENATEMAA